MSNENNVSLTAPSFNNNEHFKNALLASLYSQVEFLRKEFEEKDVIIRTLTIKEFQSNYEIKSKVAVVTVHLKAIPIMKQDQSYKIYPLPTTMHLTKIV